MSAPASPISAPAPALTDTTGILPAIAVTDVGKLYRIYAQPQDRLKESLLRRFGRNYGEDFWALRHVSFDIKPGERFGIIGRNGSGKSTLLQLIAGTIGPTEGVVQIRGRVAALLELGSGFNPEFTGRENVMVNAAIYGLSSAEIEARLDDIIAFAEIGDFIDQPVKLYSSGMFVRLAFAVSTSIDADILLIDEALAVGDVFFRQKCYRRLETLRQRQVAIVLVSHGMGDIEEFCDRSLVLDRGAPHFLGPSVEAVKRYYLIEQSYRTETADGRPAEGGAIDGTGRDEWPVEGRLVPVPLETQVEAGAARCLGLLVTDGEGQPCRVFEQGQRAVFWSEFEVLRDIAVPIAGLVIHSDKGGVVHGKSTLETGSPVPSGVTSGSRVRVRQDVTLELAAGEYTFEIGLAAAPTAAYAHRQRLLHEELASQLIRLCHVPLAGQFAIIFRRSSEIVQLLHHGVANLPGEIRLSIGPKEAL